MVARPGRHDASARRTPEESRGGTAKFEFLAGGQAVNPTVDAFDTFRFTILGSAEVGTEHSPKLVIAGQASADLDASSATASTANGGSVACLVIVLVALSAGCQDGPRAPALANETVYQNDAVGIAYVTTEGWTLFAKTTLPPGPLNRPIRLTAYGRSAEKFHAEFELYAIDVPPGTDLPDYLTAHKIGPDVWTAIGKPSALTVRGVPATRFAFAGVKADAKKRRDIVSFPRGDRQFLIAFTHHEDDVQARDQAQKAIDSVTWK